MWLDCRLVTEGTIKDTLNDLPVFQYKLLTNFSCNFKSTFRYMIVYQWYSPMHK